MIAEDGKAALANRPQWRERFGQGPRRRAAFHGEEVPSQQYEVRFVLEQPRDLAAQRSDRLPRAKMWIRDLHDAQGSPLEGRGRAAPVSYDGHPCDGFGTVRAQLQAHVLHCWAQRGQHRSGGDREGHQVEPAKGFERTIPAREKQHQAQREKGQQPHPRHEARRREGLPGNAHQPAKGPAAQARPNQVGEMGAQRQHRVGENGVKPGHRPGREERREPQMGDHGAGQ